MPELSQEIIVEALGAFFGIAYVILAIRENPLCWPVGILNAGIYIYVFLLKRCENPRLLFSLLAAIRYFTVSSDYNG
jgi:nicotinamide riboside transporter PnuC